MSSYNSLISIARKYLSGTVLGKTKRRLFPDSGTSYKANIPHPIIAAKSPTLIKPLLVVVPPYFNQEKISGAGAFIYNGFARGWAKACGPAIFVPVTKLMEVLPHYDNPAVFLSQYLFSHLNYVDVRRLRDVDLFVMVGVHPKKIKEFSQLMDDDSAEMSFMDNYSKVLFAEPKFIWNSVGKTSGEWYQGWQEDGLRWETMFVAADDDIYFPEATPEKYGHIKMAYVGGYWAEKARAFDQYFRPWEDIFIPFGYAQWPYPNYGGRLNILGERQLYSSAGLIPLVTGPGGWGIAEITERYLKAPACKAFCVADNNSAVREIFTEDEMIQVENADHFHQLVQDYLDDKIDTQRWRQKAFEAVQGRHLYSHRATQILRLLNVKE